MPNYNYVIDSSFKPFSFQEMFAPIAMYKEEYEKSEEAYDELAQKADTFKYLAKQTKDNPQAKAIYEGYANELAAQAEDLAKHGLSIGNRRALTSLKRRFQGEIGQLEQASERLKELQKQRNALTASGKFMLYANDNPTLDDMLGDGNNFNRYAIDSDDLYKLGEETGKAISSRMYDVEDGDKVLGGYYRLWKEMKGMPQEKLAAFLQSGAALDLADSLLAQKGALQNLSGMNLENARRAVLNGFSNGTIYQESATPQRDLGVPTWSEKRADERATRSQLVQEAMNGISWKDGKPVYDKNNDIALQKQLEAIREREAAKAAGKAASGTGGRGGTSYDVRNKGEVMVGAKSGKLYKHKDDDKSHGLPLESLEGARTLSEQERVALVDATGRIANNSIREAIGDGYLSDYEIYVLPSGSTDIDGSGWFFDDENDEDVYIIRPRESKRSATDTIETTPSYSGGLSEEDSNVIPE